MAGYVCVTNFKDGKDPKSGMGRYFKVGQEYSGDNGEALAEKGFVKSKALFLKEQAEVLNAKAQEHFAQAKSLEKQAKDLVALEKKSEAKKASKKEAEE